MKESFLNQGGSMGDGVIPQEEVVCLLSQCLAPIKNWAYHEHHVNLTVSDIDAREWLKRQREHCDESRDGREESFPSSAWRVTEVTTFGIYCIHGQAI